MRARTWLPGIAFAVCVALPATWLGMFVPALGPPTVAIALGAIAAAALRRWCPAVVDVCTPGLTRGAHVLLQLAIVAMGFGFAFQTAFMVGARSLPVLIGTLTVAVVGAVLLDRMLVLHGESALLIGVGTAICGASAIAAVTAVTRPATYRVGYAVATIFVFNIVAVLTYPSLGRLLHLSQETFGVWAGSVINDTSSVLAAATAFGAVAVQYAVVVKLVRSLAIIPLCIGLQLGRRGTPDAASVLRQPNPAVGRSRRRSGSGLHVDRTAPDTVQVSEGEVLFEQGTIGRSDLRGVRGRAGDRARTGRRR